MADDLSWQSVLNRLETNLAAAELHLSAPDAPALEPWALPDGLGTIPGDQLERAVALENRQRALTLMLEEAKAATGRHLAAVRSVPSFRKTGTAFYLDVTG